MKKMVVLLVLSFSISGIYPQNDILENNIKETIHGFFEGLHKGDTALINIRSNSGY